MQTFFHVILGIVIKILLYTIMTVLMVNVVYILSFPFHYLSTSQGTKLYSKEGQVFDIESNSYHTITLGDKEWTSENLRTSKFNDGRSIFHAKNIQDEYMKMKKISDKNISLIKEDKIIKKRNMLVKESELAHAIAIASLAVTNKAIKQTYYDVETE